MKKLNIKELNIKEVIKNKKVIYGVLVVGVLIGGSCYGISKMNNNIRNKEILIMDYDLSASACDQLKDKGIDANEYREKQASLNKELFTGMLGESSDGKDIKSTDTNTSDLVIDPYYNKDNYEVHKLFVEKEYKKLDTAETEMQNMIKDIRENVDYSTAMDLETLTDYLKKIETYNQQAIDVYNLSYSEDKSLNQLCELIQGEYPHIKEYVETYEFAIKNNQLTGLSEKLNKPNEAYNKVKNESQLFQ